MPLTISEHASLEGEPDAFTHAVVGVGVGPDVDGVQHGGIRPGWGAAESGRRRYRLRTAVGGPRDVDDARPGLVLRRDGTPQECAGDDHAELHLPGAGRGRL